jgi:hypothetical protein
MKYNERYHRLLVICLSLVCILYGKAFAQVDTVQDDPVLAPNTNILPVIDGNGNDLCWQNATWQNISRVWIPYAATVDSSDYYGRYKVIWSSTTNLLYFLIEVHDDVFVDGFISGVTADIYNYDIVEVFIDENKSGGLHIFDGVGYDTTNFGSNAENAFAYHTYAAFPNEGQVTTSCYVYDMDGTNWSTSKSLNNTSHIPAFSLRKTGNSAVWEFSLIVYNDTYEDGMANKELARSQLAIDKEMGLSIAYCDNDGLTENPKVRDNMYGSVWEPSPGNWHWQNADYFGNVKLIAEPSSVEGGHAVQINSMRLFPNPASSTSQLQLDNSYRGEVSIRLYNLLGQEVFRTAGSKADRLFRQSLVLNRLPSGFYFLQTRMGKSVFSEKLIIHHSK